MNRSHMVAAIVVATFALTSPAAEPTDEQLLLGFEPDEITKIIERLKADQRDVKRTEVKSTDGVERVTVGMSPWEGFQEWRLQRGEASEGQWAMAIRPIRLAVWTGPQPRPNLDEVDRHYGLYGHPSGIFHVTGVLRRVLPEDWSQFERLRFDVFVQGSPQTIRVALEDEDIVPPVVRSVRVEPGKWTTVEVDLAAVAHERGLNLKRMATVYIGCTVDDPEAAAKEARRTGEQPGTLLDHLRLSHQDVPTKLPVVRDDEPHRVAAIFQASKDKPRAIEPPPGKPDHAPIELGEPFRIATPKPCFVTPVGWVAAYDNRRMLVGFNYGGSKDAYVWQTIDGGKTWRGWDGAAEPGLVPLREMTHQAGRGDVIGGNADVMLLTNLACNGPVTAGPRLFAERLTLAADGWQRRAEPALVECDLRHCNSNQSIVRAASGRLYAAYGYTSRLGTIAIGVRYSDDDGQTWHSWRPGKNGILPGGLHSQEEGGTGFGYTFEEPCLVPLGEHVACVWCKRSGYEYREIQWSRFDGQKWSPVEVLVETKKRDSYNPTRPAIHAVSVGGREIYLVNALYKGVLHYKDGDWKLEADDVPPGSRISVAGDKHIVVIAAHGKEADLSTSPGVVEGMGGVELRAWHRLASGEWKGPQSIANEPVPLAAEDNRWYARPGYVVPPYSPPNFVPVAWSCGKDWVKVLRIPVVNE